MKKCLTVRPGDSASFRNLTRSCVGTGRVDLALHREYQEQLAAVHELTGKRVMIAETSWSYDSTLVGAYKRSVQGQADEIADCIQAMADLGDYALGMFYWEPAWIDVPGDTEAEKSEKRELYGAGWASSYAGAYDPDDAGQWWGATACVPSSLFDPEGHPLESLKAFKFARTGTDYVPHQDSWYVTEYCMTWY